MMNRFIVLLALLLCASNAFGQTYIAHNAARDTTVAVPDSIVKLFHKLVPGADSIDWEQKSYKGAEYFEVRFRQGYQEGSVTFEPDNSIDNYLVEAKMDTLPLAVRRAIARKMAGHFWSTATSIAVVSCYFQNYALKNHPNEKHSSTLYMVALYQSEAKARAGDVALRNYFNVSPEGQIRRPKLPRYVK